MRLRRLIVCSAFVLGCICGSPYSINAQDRVIKGTVKSLNGVPVSAESPGIKVTVVARILDPTRVQAMLVKSGTFNAKDAMGNDVSEYRVEITNAEINDIKRRLNGKDNLQIDISFSSVDRLPASLSGLALDMEQTISVVLPEAGCGICRPRRFFGRFRCASVDVKGSAVGAVDSGTAGTAMVSAAVGLGEQFVDAGGEFREWTNQDGTATVKALLLYLEDGVAVFERLDGRVARTRLERLSTADQEWIRKWQAADLVAALPLVAETR